MAFSLWDEQRIVQDTFHAFAQRVIRLLAQDLDENPRFPREFFSKVGEQGFFNPQQIGPDCP